MAGTSSGPTPHPDVTRVSTEFTCTVVEQRLVCCCGIDAPRDLGVVVVQIECCKCLNSNDSGMSSRYRLAYLPTTIHNPLHPYAMFLLNSTFFWFKSEQLALYSFLYTYLHVPLWQSLAFWIWIFVYLYPSCIYVPYIWGLNLDRNIHPVAVLKICLYILHSIYVVGPC